MDAAELVEWAEFDAAHVPESWYQTALICLTVSRAFGGNANLTIDHFLPPRARPRTAPAPADELKARIAAFRERHNARIAAEANAPCPQSPASTSS